MQLQRGELKMLQTMEETILMVDGKGAYETMEFKSPDQPNEGLGHWICLDDNQEYTYNAIMKDMT